MAQNRVKIDYLMFQTNMSTVELNLRMVNFKQHIILYIDVLYMNCAVKKSLSFCNLFSHIKPELYHKEISPTSKVYVS